MAAHIDTTAGEATVYPVTPGSLIVLRDASLDAAEVDHLVAEVTRAAGHSRFVVLVVDGGDARVIGPEELIAWLRQAVDRHDGAGR